MMEIENPGRALDLSKGFRAGHLFPFEYLPGAERPLELAAELFQVVLYDAVKAHEIAVDIVEDFNRAGWGKRKNKAALPAKTST